MELRHLRYFVAVAEELSFTAAARRLNISQPPLSQQIRDLEAEIGTPLFDRTSRRVALTAAGRGFLAQARAALAQLARAVEDARTAASTGTDNIYIGTTGSVLLGPLSGLIARFHTEHPGATVRIFEMGPGEQLDALLGRRIDICFLRRPRHEPDLLAELAWRETVCVALPANHPLTAQPVLRLSALAGQDFVFLRLNDSRFARYLEDCCVQAGFTPRISHEVLESYSLTSLVAAGLGVALVPESIRALSRAGIVYRPLLAPAPIADVEMITRPDRPEALDSFIRLARDTFAATGAYPAP